MSNPSRSTRSDVQSNELPRVNGTVERRNMTESRRRESTNLGDLHQELESEQEGQVNRLLNLIRTQQEQLAAVERERLATTSSPLADPRSRPQSLTNGSTPMPTSISDVPLSPAIPSTVPTHHTHQSSSARSSRRSSARRSFSSGLSAPLQRSTTEDVLAGGSRDEAAFYQVETQNLTRENEMLKMRIRELERQIAQLSAATPALDE